MNIFRILIIDDHPFICLGLKLFLDNWSEKEPTTRVNCTLANTLTDGLTTFSKDPLAFDLVILDIRMPPCPNEKLFSGEDLGLRIKRLRPKIKIMVITSLIDQHQLFSIFKSLNPDAMLVKSDIDDVTFIKAIKNVMNNKPYYSGEFSMAIRHRLQNDRLLPEDRQILYYLSKGIPTKDLPKKIALSLSSIEKRKNLLRKHFGLNGHNDLELVHLAREKGFL
ncbi:response regulator [Maribacter chungangensis]|uniref:Response regulator n=1 Tax=Maribacter chungangensis TaxID=1069117 RepID=A0ABW3B4T7_9FLAO